MTGQLVNYDPEIHSWTSIIDQHRSFHSILYDHDHKTLQVLNQLKLPHLTEYIPIKSVDEAYSVIRNMEVRGAPLIATVGTLGLSVHLASIVVSNFGDLVTEIEALCEKLVSSRPTAINLRNAISDIRAFVAAEQQGSQDGDKLIKKIQESSYEWYLNERKENDMLLRNATICVESNQATESQMIVMTICNTGSLATSSFGTALGVIRQLHERKRLKLAIALETRPYNQGSRLTAYELTKENIPFILITDSMAAAAMQNYNVDSILVGADQIALNGDTANKIGTYMLAVLANYHKVPFYVVSPTSSINKRIASGKEIKIEERPQSELITVNGTLTALPSTPVWNPAFDVTPSSLISSILTEKGNVRPDNVSSLFC